MDLLSYRALAADAVKAIDTLNQYAEQQLSHYDEIEEADNLAHERAEWIGVLGTLNGWLRDYVATDLYHSLTPAHEGELLS